MKDKFYLGILYGIALPLLAYVVGEMIQEEMQKYLSRRFFYIVCIGLNVIIFRIAIKKKYDQLARGILFSTFIYAIAFAYSIMK